MIPYQAVAAANKALGISPNGLTIPEIVKVILEAAAPHMLAQAWDEGSVAGWVESGLPHSWNAENSLRNSNPYRPTP